MHKEHGPEVTIAILMRQAIPGDQKALKPSMKSTGRERAAG
jgi:hypothetical protein